MHLKYPVVLLLFLIPLAMGGVSCRGDVPSGSAEGNIRVLSISPKGAYPGAAPTKIHFDIDLPAGKSASHIQWKISFGDGSTTEGRGKSADVVHLYTKEGTYTIKIEASTGDGPLPPIEKVYHIYSPLDLAALSAQGRPTSVHLSDTLHAILELENKSHVPLQTPVSLSVFLTLKPNTDGQTPSDLVKLGDVTLTETLPNTGIYLAASQKRQVVADFSLPQDLPSGAYFLAYAIDNKHEIADTDRGNDFVVSHLPINVIGVDTTAHDIILSRLIVAPDHASPSLDYVNRSFVVYNHSAKDVGNITIKTYLSVGDDKLDSNDLLIETISNVELGPEERKSYPPKDIVFTPIPATSAGKEVWVITQAEIPPAVKDSDASNNTLVSSPISVTDAPASGPDIAVKTLDVSPFNTYIDGPVNVSAKISNIGSADAVPFSCRVYLGKTTTIPRVINDHPFTSINVSSGIQAGKSTTVKKTVTIPSLFSVGTYYPYIVCDPSRVLGESYRTNNQLIQSQPLTVVDKSDTDLYVSSLTYPTTSTDGTPLTVDVKVCNHGTTSSLANKSKLYTSFLSSANDIFQGGAVEFQVPVIGPEKCVSLPVPLTPQCIDYKDHLYLGVALDADGDVTETNETNNQYVDTNSLVLSGPYCSCVDPYDAYPHHAEADALTMPASPVSGAICQPGVCDYFKVDVGLSDSILVHMKQDVSHGPLTLSVTTPSGVSDVINSHDDHIYWSAFDVKEKGDYIVKVCSDGTSVNNYSIDWSKLTPTTKPDLVPGRVSFDKHQPFPRGANIHVESEIHNIGLADSGPFAVKVVLSSNGTIGDADDVVLYHAGSYHIKAEGSLNVSIPVTLPSTLTDGNYYIALIVDPDNQVSESAEGNNMVISTSVEVRTQCYDRFEPNHTFSDAAALTPAQYDNLKVCPANSDFYKVCPANGSSLEAEITYSSTSYTDLDLVIYDSTQHEVARGSKAAGGSETAKIDYVNGAQCYYVEVKPVYLPTKEANYALTIKETKNPPSLVCDSTFESNDNFTRATPIARALSMSTPIDLCPIGDVDIYQFPLQLGQTVTLSATKSPSNQTGILSVQLYKPAATPTDPVLPANYEETGPGVPSATIKNFVAPVSGVYYLEVAYSGSLRKTTYTLSASGLSGVDLFPSHLHVGFGAYHPGDVLRYEFDVTNLLSTSTSASSYHLYLSTDSTLDKLTATDLGSTTLPTIAGNANIHTGGMITLPAALSAGTWYLFVVVDDSSDLDLSNNTISSPLTIQ